MIFRRFLQAQKLYAKKNIKNSGESIYDMRQNYRNYNSYLGFNPETGTAVVVLSNLAPNYRVPATVLGVKLLLELDNKK